MPKSRTQRLEARITPKTESQLEELSRSWGGIRPLSKTDAIEEAIDRAWLAEGCNRKKPETTP